MTVRDNIKKWVYYSMIVAYCTFGYLLINHINNMRSWSIDVALPLDRALPFVPFLIIGYTFYFLSMLLIPITIDDWRIFNRGVLLFMVVATVHFVIFLLLPVRMDLRPVLDMSFFWQRVVAGYYNADHPFNCLPSLHVSLPFLATLILWNYKRHWAYFMAFSTAFVIVSVILVKQHYILDAVASIVVTGVVYWIISLFVGTSLIRPRRSDLQRPARSN